MLSELIAKLPSLSQQDLRTLKAAIEHLLTKTTESEPTLYDAMRKVLGDVPHYDIFKKSNVYAIWRKHNDYAEMFIAKNFPEATKVQRLALMTFTVRALVNDLKSRDVPITVGSVAKNLGRFAAMFEGQFPGYLSSGMGPLILKALQEK
jgi:hypothetical protein